MEPRARLPSEKLTAIWGTYTQIQKLLYIIEVPYLYDIKCFINASGNSLESPVSNWLCKTPSATWENTEICFQVPPVTIGWYRHYCRQRLRRRLIGSQERRSILLVFCAASNTYNTSLELTASSIKWLVVIFLQIPRTFIPILQQRCINPTGLFLRLNCDMLQSYTLRPVE